MGEQFQLVDIQPVILDDVVVLLRVPVVLAYVFQGRLAQFRKRILLICQRPERNRVRVNYIAVIEALNELADRRRGADALLEELGAPNLASVFRAVAPRTGAESPGTRVGCTDSSFRARLRTSRGGRRWRRRGA